jgi:hypothetical protein
MPKVYNKKIDIIPEGAVYVGRPTKWGNPYKVGKCYSLWLTRKHIPFTNEDAVKAYRLHIQGREEEIKQELRGKDLVCWCAPEPCHADVLLEIANS